MHHAETLYAFAQVAVAFAGFAGLMAFVRGRRTGPLAGVHRTRLVGMVRVALIATTFSLVPVVVSSQGLSDNTTWRVSGALFALAFAPTTVIAWRRTIFVRRAGLRPAVPLLPHTATVALLLMTCSALVEGHNAGLYLAALSLVLLVSGALFFTLVVTLLDETDE